MGHRQQGLNFNQRGCKEEGEWGGGLGAIHTYKKCHKGIRIGGGERRGEGRSNVTAF